MTLSLVTTAKVWHQLADTPFTFSPCALLRGHLLIVGGYTSDKEESKAIHAYNTVTNSWEVISHMATPRHQSLVAVLPHNQLMVVGGCTMDNMGTDSVEIATDIYTLFFLETTIGHSLICVHFLIQENERYRYFCKCL